MELYNKRVWLTDESSSSTGSLVCFHGPNIWEPKELSMFVEVGSCSAVARLHQAGVETQTGFRNKVAKMRDELTLFIDYLDGLQQ